MTYTDVPLTFNPFCTEIYDYMKKKKKVEKWGWEERQVGNVPERGKRFLGWDGATISTVYSQ